MTAAGALLLQETVYDFHDRDGGERVAAELLAVGGRVADDGRVGPLLRISSSRMQWSPTVLRNGLWLRIMFALALVGFQIALGPNL